MKIFTHTLVFVLMLLSCLSLINGQGRRGFLRRWNNGMRGQSQNHKNNTGSRPEDVKGDGIRPNNLRKRFMRTGKDESWKSQSRSNYWQQDWSDVLRASWNTSLSNGLEINERGFISPNNKVAFLMSKDGLLINNGYQQSFTLIDFSVKKLAIRVELPDMVRSSTQSKEFWANKNHACFIMDAPASLFDVSQELQLRSSVSWAGPIPVGKVQTYIVESKNQITDVSNLGKISRLCRRASQKGKAYILVSESTVATKRENITVLGQVDPKQALASVPFDIKIEDTIHII